MSSRAWTIPPVALSVAAVMVVAPAAALDRKPPRIVAAAVLDVDGDSLADRVRLTYSERVRHPVDRDGRYPFAVPGYRIRLVGKAAGKVLLIHLVEGAQPDSKAAPAIRYRRTSAQPVRDQAGNQAQAQVFVKTRAHGNAPAAPPTPADGDGDGTPDADDCAANNPAIHPGAADVPDLGFVDSNCDGIDGTEQDAVFASPTGNDANPGTKAQPMREIAKAVSVAGAGKQRYVLVAFGTYKRVVLTPGISIYGGYDPTSWERRDRFPDGLPLIEGSPEGILANGAKGVALQHLEIRGSNGPEERSAYGIRALNSSGVTLQRVAVSAGDGRAGTPGAIGTTGPVGGGGGQGGNGSCDGGDRDNAAGGRGGLSPFGRPGGTGGIGGNESNFHGTTHGLRGGPGKIGTPGGAGGDPGNPGKPGGKGARGENGATGAAGAGGTSSTVGAGADGWEGQRGSVGRSGEPGNGGGGGGGGGSQQGKFVNNGGGNGGGGGGAGGGGGTRGGGGSYGGGSFGVYLVNSKIVVEGSTITAGTGGAGGRGGDGGFGGAGGAGGTGGKRCTSEVGAGGDGGFGGAGGRGGGAGGGDGGPSIGIVKVGTSTATIEDGSTVKAGTAGAGGAGGHSGLGGIGGAGAAGIAKPMYP